MPSSKTISPRPGCRLFECCQSGPVHGYRSETARIQSGWIARQLMCQLWSDWAVQPFLIEVAAAIAGGSASMIPQRPPPVVRCWSATLPRTSRIVLSSQSVQAGPAAVPEATHCPSRTASAGDIVVTDHSLMPGVCVLVRPQTLTSSWIVASPPSVWK